MKDLVPIGAYEQERLLALIQQDSPETQALTIPPIAISYLALRVAGVKHTEAMERLDASAVDMVLWTQHPQFACAYAKIKQAEAIELEAVIWEQAKNPKNTVERLAAIKARLPEYRDNAQPQGPTTTTVNITLSGAPIDVSASYKTIVEDDLDEQA